MKHSKAFMIFGLACIIIGFWRIWKIDHEHVHAIYRIEQAIGIKKHVKTTTSSSKTKEENDDDDNGPYVATDLQGYWKDYAGNHLHITDKHLWITNNNNEEYNFINTIYNGTVYVFSSKDTQGVSIEIDDSQDNPQILYADGNKGFNSTLSPDN